MRLKDPGINGLYPPADSFLARDTMFKSAGVKRCPRKGEWYLSGAIVQAYYAFNDLSSPYYIAVPVKGTWQRVFVMNGG